MRLEFWVSKYQCYAMLRYAMLRYAMLRYAMLHYAILPVSSNLYTRSPACSTCLD
jgi:hypothetical protein